MRDVYQFYKDLISVKKAHSARRKRTIHVRVDVWVEDAVSDSIITLIRCSVFHSFYLSTYHIFLPLQALRDRVRGIQAGPLLHWGEWVRGEQEMGRANKQREMESAKDQH